MKPPPFQYHRPQSVADALRCLADHENARVLAGGQSLMPMLNLRIAYPDHLVDLGSIADLAYIREEGDEIAIGAMTAQRTIEFSGLVARRLPLMAEAILSVGHRQTRNRGTIGGSLCHLDPSAELALMATVYGATIVIAGPDGDRRLAMREFAAGYMSPAIETGEIVTEVRFDPWAPGHGWGFTEIARRRGDFAIVAAAALVELEGDGRIRRAALALGGVAPVPLRVAAAEEALAGRIADDALLARATAACADVEPLEDAHVAPWYRRRLAPRLAQRVLANACRRARETRA